MVIVPAGIIEEGKTGKSRPYTEHLSKKAGAGKIPPAPTGESILLLESVFFARMLVLTVCFIFVTGYSQREAPTIEGAYNLLALPSMSF
jgi:hypothetical protein